jgi:RNA polymerase sigma-70 factor (ECF subfamily)
VGIGTRFFRPRLVSSARRRERVEDSTASAARAEQFRLVMLPHLDGAYNFARYLTRDATAAEDIVQDAFLRAFRNFDSWRGDAPKAWLLTIVRNCFLNSLAARGRHAGIEPTEEIIATDPGTAEAETPETIVAQRTEVAMLRNTIENLPEPFRETLVLREFEDLSYKDIALLTNVPIGTVMSRIARARGMLAELLLPDGEAGRRARS